MKRGQMQISFGMIFSIILIVIFLASAFYAIKVFFKMQDTAMLGKFFSEFQSDVDRVWRSTESSQERNYFLPSKVDYICFTDFSSRQGRGKNSSMYSELQLSYYGNENLFVYPVGLFEMESNKIKNIALNEITQINNPFCIEVIKGKLKLKLVKNIGEALVRIEE